ncbi:MAG: hypothetical protein FD138_2403 [Planctomycetota bacterium]|nr:MAG: hypothetical protein FD138_2403 [Planctomycetota bacterium]
MSAIPVLITLLCLGQSPAESPKADAVASEASLKALTQRVENTRVQLTKQTDLKLKVVAAPVFRYSDELRHIEDAGLWLWTDRGRPAVAMKVERYKPGVHPRPWLYCFTSLSSELISAEWPDERKYQARKPGVEWKPLDDQPAKTRPARLVQMRDIARRFSAEVLDFNNDPRQMRLLSRPLYRQDDGNNGDGALFGFTGTGTNPDLLLLLEAKVDGGWQYGLVTMTAEGLRVRLSDRLVWDIPHTGGKGTEFDNWLYFSPRH